MDWISVRLLIRSPDVVPASITRQLGVEPTNSHIPNTPVTRKDGSTGAVRAEGFWSRSILKEEVGDIDVADAAIQLLKQMPSDPAVWLALPAVPTLIFSLGMPRSNCGFNIAPDLGGFAADRGIVLGFDIYGESIWAKD